MQTWKKPVHIHDYPQGPCFQAGHLVSENSSWRSETPVINFSKCKLCFQCYLYCPEGSIAQRENRMKIDLRFCKGCGICVKECRFGAIRLEKEE